MARPRKYPYGADIRSPHLSFSASDVCLNFANTRELRKGDQPQEYLRHYDDLLIFCRRVELLSDGDLRQLQRLAVRSSRKAQSALREALRLREAIYQTMSHAARGKRAHATDLGTIDRLWKKGLRSSQIAWKGSRYEIEWKVEADLGAAWWPVAKAATELMCSARLDLVRECGGADCGWLFLDTSRNKRRRWCDMRTCGNRAKAARHYSRSGS